MKKKAEEISFSLLIRSAISDKEISDCLNTKKEIELKTRLWELMYKDCFDKKKQKGDGNKKAKSDSRNNKRKREEKAPLRSEKSSKINYEALRRLRGEFGDGGEPGPGDGEEERFRESVREEAVEEEEEEGEEEEERGGEERGGYGYGGGEGYYSDGGYGDDYYEEDDEGY